MVKSLDKFYYLITRSEYGLVIKILAGLVTYLWPAIYFRELHNEEVSIERIIELRIKIENKALIACNGIDGQNIEKHEKSKCYAKLDRKLLFLDIRLK